MISFKLMSGQPAATPTFCLFRLDPIVSVAEYLKNPNERFTIPKFKLKITSTSEQGLINATHSATPIGRTFSFTSRSNHEHVFVTTNNVQFEAHNINAKPKVRVPCEWCKLTYDDMGGVPVTVIPIISPISGETICSFGMDGSICDYRCCLAYIMSVSRGDSRYNTTSNSESWLKIMYDLTYPKGPALEAAPHYRHLDSNGGIYPLSQYKSTRYRFVNVGSFVMESVKGCHQRVMR